jgi:hypothetical protein
VDAGPPKPGPGAPEKLRRRDPALIRQHFDVGQVGRIVHGHVHELPSRSAMSPAPRKLGSERSSGMTGRGLSRRFAWSI